MYKASYAAGETWYEWIKMGVRHYVVYKINGDGSHTHIASMESVKSAREDVRYMNDKYATRGGLLKVARMMEAEDFLSKKALEEFAPSATGLTRMEAVDLSDNIPF